EQLVPVKARLPYGKSNLLLDLQKMQKNPIFRISVDILQNKNFFRAFAASANVPSNYIQQFWNTMTHEANIGAYRFQLDEQWFTLNSDLLCDAMEITPVDPSNPFVSPPAGEIVMDFVNKLGYLKEIHFVSHMHVNNLFQMWRAILSLINQCLTGKTFGNDKPRHLEEFVQGIQTFFTHRDSNKIPSKKPTPYVIPYCRFTKLIIYYLGNKYNIHRRPESPRHVMDDDFLLGNLKFVPNGEKDDVFGMLVPQELSQKLFKRPNTTNNTWKWLLAKSKKTSKPPLTNKSRKGKVHKVRKEKRPLKLIDEDEEVLHEPESQGEGEDYDHNRAIQMSLETFQGHGQAPVGGVAFREHAASGITQKLPVVDGKGKRIAIDE
ncbi:hypothetical protein Tco_0987378, partial [Tanacetum coccineum]